MRENVPPVDGWIFLHVFISEDHLEEGRRVMWVPDMIQVARNHADLLVVIAVRLMPFEGLPLSAEFIVTRDESQDFFKEARRVEVNVSTIP